MSTHAAVLMCHMSNLKYKEQHSSTWKSLLHMDDLISTLSPTRESSLFLHNPVSLPNNFSNCSPPTHLLTQMVPIPLLQHKTIWGLPPGGMPACLILQPFQSALAFASTGEQSLILSKANSSLGTPTPLSDIDERSSYPRFLSSFPVFIFSSASSFSLACRLALKFPILNIIKEWLTFSHHRTPCNYCSQPQEWPS